MGPAPRAQYPLSIRDADDGRKGAYDVAIFPPPAMPNSRGGTFECDMVILSKMAFAGHRGYLRNQAGIPPAFPARKPRLGNLGVWRFSPVAAIPPGGRIWGDTSHSFSFGELNMWAPVGKKNKTPNSRLRPSSWQEPRTTSFRDMLTTLDS